MGTIEVFIVIVVVSFILFLMLRELNNWYWKINERIYLQKKTNILLENILKKMTDNISEYRKDPESISKGKNSDQSIV